MRSAEMRICIDARELCKGLFSLLREPVLSNVVKLREYFTSIYEICPYFE